MKKQSGADGLSQAMKVVAESSGVSVRTARTQYGSVWRERSRLIARLIKQGYPPEIGVLLPLYWIAKRPEGWYVLGGAFGTECVSGRLYAYYSREEAEAEVAFYNDLNLKAVQALHPAQFTEQVRADMRQLESETA
ncbi:MAG: hypothetical protein ACYCRD_04540 [Leptospirillum sp.]